MTTYRFAVTAPTGFGTRYVVSRHATLKAAQRALRLAKVPGFEVIPL